MKLNKFGIIFSIVILTVILLSGASVRAQQTSDSQSSGGAFTLEKTVVAGGGSRMQQDQTSIGNTVGQAVAGKQSSGGNFTLYSGFWTPEGFAPTSANVVVGGQIKTPDGRGIRNVRVTITYPTGQTQTTLSGTFGYYRFAEISVGGTYIISVSAKKYVFAQSTQFRTILDEVLDINFVADSLS